MNITDIHSPADIKGKSLAELQQICAELRKVLLKNLQRTAVVGHRFCI